MQKTNKTKIHTKTNLFNNRYSIDDECGPQWSVE